MDNIKLYLKNIWTIMPIHSKDEKVHLLAIKEQLHEFLDDYPECTYEDIVQQFGEPKDVVIHYLQSMEEDELIGRMKIRSLIQTFLMVLTTACIILAIYMGSLWYGYVQEEKDSIIYDIETTITEE